MKSKGNRDSAAYGQLPCMLEKKYLWKVNEIKTPQPMACVLLFWKGITVKSKGNHPGNRPFPKLSSPWPDSLKYGTQTWFSLSMTPRGSWRKVWICLEGHTGRQDSRMGQDPKGSRGRLDLSPRLKPRKNQKPTERNQRNQKKTNKNKKKHYNSLKNKKNMCFLHIQ